MLPASDAAGIYRSHYERNSRAIGVLWAIFTVLLAIVDAVCFVQPYWIGDGADTPQAGYFGLFHYCIGNGLSRDLSCRGSLAEFGGIPSAAFQAASVFIGASMVLVLSCIGCFGLFFCCGTGTVYKTCGWMQLAAGACLILGCMIYPDGWDSDEVKRMCGERTDKYALGACSVRWAYILAIMGILDALILSFLAFVLGNRQDVLTSEELLGDNQGGDEQSAAGSETREGRRPGLSEDEGLEASSSGPPVPASVRKNLWEPKLDSGLHLRKPGPSSVLVWGEASGQAAGRR
ncbi:LHFPL tetraspan subfamily member 3 protein [Neosynchiropus ocellatus]